MRKLFSIHEIAEQLQNSRVGKKVVYCSGTFDIVHCDHIYFLEQVKSYGDIVVVGINDDVSVSRRKGPARPIIPEEKRIIVVSAISFVDFAFIKKFDLHKEDIIEILQPNVVIANNDKDRSEYYIKRWDSLAAKFPSVEFILSLEHKRDENNSTTAIINKIKKLG